MAISHLCALRLCSITALGLTVCHARHPYAVSGKTVRHPRTNAHNLPCDVQGYLAHKKHTPSYTGGIDSARSRVFECHARHQFLMSEVPMYRHARHQFLMSEVPLYRRDRQCKGAECSVSLMLHSLTQTVKHQRANAHDLPCNVHV